MHKAQFPALLLLFIHPSRYSCSTLLSGTKPHFGHLLHPRLPCIFYQKSSVLQCGAHWTGS